MGLSLLEYVVRYQTQYVCLRDLLAFARGFWQDFKKFPKFYMSKPSICLSSGTMICCNALLWIALSPKDSAVILGLIQWSLLFKQVL